MEQTHNRQSISIVFVIFILVALIPVILVVGNNFIPKQADNLEIFSKEADLSKPVKTNSWFTSIYAFPSQPIYALPGVYKISADGIGISFPEVAVSENVVKSSYNEQCNFSFDVPILRTEVLDYGDWDVLVEFETSKGKGKVHIIQGSPLIYFEYSADIVLECGDDFETELLNRNTAHIFTENKDFIVVSDEQLSIDGSALVIPSSKFKFGIMPEFSESLVELFVNTNSVNAGKTKYSWSTTYSEIESILGFSDTTTLTTIWPHHKQHIKGEYQVLGTYDTSMGQLDLVSTKEIKLSFEKPNLPFGYSPTSNDEYFSQIKSVIAEDVERYSSAESPKGVYFKGTNLGALASLAQLADVYESVELERILDMLENELVNSMSSFKYDPKKSLLVSTNSEFGNKLGNDHHFHYGYYIRAASVLVNYRPQLLETLEPTINEMIADIASSNAGRYPRLRSFSPYEGHSWADGAADFLDGNNQESTSEALNAWYAVRMWGEVSGKKEIEDLGYSLFAHELAGTKAYWFGESNPFSEGYDHQISSIVWGGKRDFSTWFSADVMHIYGIQFLPITPASDYLGEFENPRRYIREMESAYDNPYAHEWGDLYAIFKSKNEELDKDNVVSRVESTEGVKLRSLFIHSVLE